MTADPHEFDTPLSDQTTRESLGSTQQLGDFRPKEAAARPGARFPAITPPSLLPKASEAALALRLASVSEACHRNAVGDNVQQPSGAVACDPGRRGQPAPTRTGPGRLPKHRACAAATPSDRRGDQPGSCRTTCGTPAPAARRSPGGPGRAPCPCTAGHQARPGVPGLDAVPQPVRAGRRARLVPQRLSQPGGMVVLGGGLGVVAVGDLLGQILSQVADAASRVLGPSEHSLGVEPLPEPGHVMGFSVGADIVQGLVPGRQHLPGGRVEVAPGVLVPDRQLVPVVPHRAVSGHQTWW